ncbi:MATE family efflux transporter [Chachezhania sediminis]|uniref:MATE family efflux transporter n=1 Tax=Chachezhania sediminis TaxID=2599291 RepID=UPI00131D25D9|nr:MATE family efflux transporter [Chachezhania sediminis]
MTQQARFLTGSTMGHVARMTLTGAFGMTFVFVVDAANLFWISLLGDPQLLAAMGFAFALQLMSVSTGVGMMIGAVALISRSIGAGDMDRARRLATSAAITAFIVQAGVATGLIAFRYPLLGLLGASGETADIAARYLVISLPTIAIMAFGMVGMGTLRAQGDARRSLMVTLSAGIVAMVLDPLMIYVLGWGVDGAALGVNLFRGIMCIQALRFTIRVHDLMAKPNLHDVIHNARAHFAVAIPAIATQLSTPVGNALLTAVIAPFGDAAIAGWTVIGRMTVVAFAGIFSLAGAIGGIFGQNYGARNPERLRSAYRDAMIFGACYTLITWVLLAWAADGVIDGLGLPPEAGKVVHAFTDYAAVAFFFVSALFVSNAAFNTLGRPLWSTGFNWIRDGIITLPLGLAFAAWFGANGVIYAQAVASVLVGGIAGYAGWRYVRQLSRQMTAAAAVPTAPASVDPVG